MTAPLLGGANPASLEHRLLVAHGKQSRSLASYNKQLLVGNTECHSLDEEEGHFGTMYPLNVRNLLKAALE